MLLVNCFKEVFGFHQNDELDFLYEPPVHVTTSNIRLCQVPGHKNSYVRATNRKWKDLLSWAIGDGGTPSRGRKPLPKKKK